MDSQGTQHMLVTMYIKNKRDCSNIKACSPFELSCLLKVLCFEIAYFSYTERYCDTKSYYIIVLQEVTTD